MKIYDLLFLRIEWKVLFILHDSESPEMMCKEEIQKVI